MPHTPRPLTRREEAFLARHHGEAAPEPLPLPRICAALGRTAQEIRTATRQRRQGDAERDALVMANLRLTAWAACRFWNRLPRRAQLAYTLDDARGDAVVGLFRAAELFDPAIGQFSTYADRWMRQAMQRGLEAVKFVHVPRGRGELLPSVAVVVNSECLALESAASRSPGPPDELIAREAAAELSADARDLLRRLHPRERDVLLRRLAGQTLEEIGRGLGVTKERVRQIQNKAMRRIRIAIGDDA